MIFQTNIAFAFTAHIRYRIWAVNYQKNEVFDRLTHRQYACAFSCYASKKKISSTGRPSRRATFIASSSVGSYLLFSIATIVWRDTPNKPAKSSCRRPRARRSSLIQFFMRLYYHNCNRKQCPQCGYCNTKSQHNRKRFPKRIGFIFFVSLSAAIAQHQHRNRLR